MRGHPIQVSWIVRRCRGEDPGESCFALSHDWFVWIQLMRLREPVKLALAIVVSLDAICSRECKRSRA